MPRGKAEQMRVTRRQFLKATALTTGGIAAAGVGIPVVLGEKPVVFEHNDSFWALAQPPANPALDADIEVDVAIIGGGYTGLSTAWHLKQRNPRLKVVVLEARLVGHGASGRNGGMILPQTGLECLEIARDETTHKWTYDLTVDSMKTMERLITDTGMDCELKLKGYCYAILDEEDVPVDRAYIEQVRKLGMPIEFWNEDRTADALGTEYYYGSIYDPNGGSVHAMKLVAALKKAAETVSVTVYENSPVVRIEEGPRIRLTVGEVGRSVMAGAIVLATNAYTSKLGYFKHQVMPMHAQCAVTPPLTKRQLKAMAWESRLPFFDSRNYLYHLILTADRRIVIGGGNAEYFFRNDLHYRGDLARVGNLMRAELVRMFPSLEGIEFERIWNGVLGMSYDETEAVGVMGKHNNIYYGLAYNGHGINLSFLFGNVIANMFSRAGHGWDKTAFAKDHLSRIPPEPFKWIGVQSALRYYRWQDEG